jgi:hypothetical protein
MNKAEITADRTRHVLPFNPNSARPDEEIYVNIPKLKADSVLVPDSTALVFDFKNSNTKSLFRNNLGKLLQRRLEIRLAGEKVYDNSGESLLEVYKDLWLHRKQRDDIVEDAGADPAPELTDAYIRPHGGSREINLGNAISCVLSEFFCSNSYISVTKILLHFWKNT